MIRQLDTVPEDWNRPWRSSRIPTISNTARRARSPAGPGPPKTVGYVIATDGEAGIDGLTPVEAGPLRQKEQLASAAVVGVADVTFLGHRDGVVESGLALRRDIARQIRRFRPEVLLTATYEFTYAMAPGQRIVNQADHRAVGVAVLDAARDAGNRWIFPDLLDEGLQPWDGVRHVYLMGSDQPTHAVDVTDHLHTGIASLRAHEAYLRGLGRDFDPEQFLRTMTTAAGASIGARHAVALTQIQLQGV